MTDDKEKLERVKELAAQVDFSPYYSYNSGDFVLFLKTMPHRNNNYNRLMRFEANKYMLVEEIKTLFGNDFSNKKFTEYFQIIKPTELPANAQIQKLEDFETAQMKLDRLKGTKKTEEQMLKEQIKQEKEQERLEKQKEKEQAKQQKEQQKEIEHQQKQFQREQRQKYMKEQEEATLRTFMELPITKFVIYQNKEETQYKITLENKHSFTLNGEELLKSTIFRTRYFSETGLLPPPIYGETWTEFINALMEQKGEIIDKCKKDNTNDFIIENILHEMNNFVVVTNPEEALSYGRLYFNKEEPYYLFLHNKTLDNMRKKMEFKITVGKLRYILEEYIDGESRVIRTSPQHTQRFLPFKIEQFPSFMPSEKSENKENNIISTYENKKEEEKSDTETDS